MVRSAPDELQILLATLPPSQRQIRLAAGVVAALVVAFVVTTPFAHTQLPQIDAFIPVVDTAIAINDLITSALLFAQFAIVARRQLFVIATGFLFTGLMAIPHMLTFPGAFAPTGLLGAGLQSTGWLYGFWKSGLPLAALLYVLLKERTTVTGRSRNAPTADIGWTIAAVIALVCGLTWIASDADWLLPNLYLDSIRGHQGALMVFAACVLSLNAAALALLWVRRRSVLDLWLLVMCCALMVEGILGTVLSNNRYELGWYAGRVYGYIATIFVLLVLLSETTVLYAHLARSVIRQRGEREARQTAMDVMAASIAHEINQPLGSVVANANAAFRWLARETPDLDEARAALTRIAKSGHRASEVIAGVRAMFKKDMHGRALFDANDLVREVLTMVDVDLRAQRISVSIELQEALPRLLADRGQLQQVVLNLTMNAIDAMRPVADRPRRLRITTHILPESSDVLITIEDSGAGIDAKDKDRIFEPFFTTKATGTGIGLTICRSIIESHGGRLQARANNPHGTIFLVALPANIS